MNTVEILHSWSTLNTFISGATEDEARKLLEIERGSASRLGFLKRIHSRYNKMRAARELSELTNEAKNKYTYTESKTK